MKKILSLAAMSLLVFACGDGHAETRPNSQSQVGLDKCPEPDPETWEHEVDYLGHRFFVVPDQIRNYQLQLENGSIIACRQPQSWKALDSNLAISMDPKFRDQRRITMINGKPFGSESKGGIYIRHNLISKDPTDVNLGWFLNPAPLVKADAEAGLRHLLAIPSEQALTILAATDVLASRGSYPIQSVAFALADEPILYWAYLATDPGPLWPTLRFLPLGAPPAEATIEAAWTASRILDLSVFNLWDVEAGHDALCTLATCRQQVDDVFYKIYAQGQTSNRDVCVHLGWDAGAFGASMVSTVCVNPLNGTLNFKGTRKGL